MTTYYFFKSLLIEIDVWDAEWSHYDHPSFQLWERISDNNKGKHTIDDMMRWFGEER